MIDAVTKVIDQIFDRIEHMVEGTSGQRLLGTLLVMSFLGGILVIELNRLGLLPRELAADLPTNHLVAVELVFTMLLTIEVVKLVFSLVGSVANSLGKQFEVLSLILLRDTFKEFSHFSEPLVWSDVVGSLEEIISTSVGALLIFVVLGFYYRMQRHRPITNDAMARSHFMQAKKFIALSLLIGFMVIGLSNIFALVRGVTPELGTFETFYTLLVFSDILIVLISLRYSNSYHIAFRNSGFTVATVLIRVALIAPVTIGAVMGVGAALFALGITAAYNTFGSDIVDQDQYHHQEAY